MNFQRRPYLSGFPDDRLIWKLFFSLNRYRRFVVSIFVTRRYEASRKIQWEFRKHFAVRAIALPFGLISSQLCAFSLSLFFLHFDNWVIYRINGWHRSNLVFKRGTGGTVFKIPINRFFLVRNEIGDANFKVFEMLIFLLEFLFFFHSLNRLFCRRTLIFEWTPRTCIVDRRIYILRARIIELYNIRFHITV